MPSFQDIVDLQEDTSKVGADTRNWQDLVPAMPCQIVDLGGSEMWRGRQVEAGTTHVVMTKYSEEFGELLAKYRLQVVESTWLEAGTVINVERTAVVRRPGLYPMVELYCKRLTD